MATFRNTEHQKISAITPNGWSQGSHKCSKRKSVMDMVALSPSIASIIPAKNKVSPNVKATNAGIMIAQISINSMKLDKRSMNHVRKKLRRRASRAGTPNATKSSELWCGTRKEETPRAASAADMGKLDWYYGGIWGNGSRYPRCQMSCLWDLIAFVYWCGGRHICKATVWCPEAYCSTMACWANMCFMSCVSTYNLQALDFKWAVNTVITLNSFNQFHQFQINMNPSK